MRIIIQIAITDSSQFGKSLTHFHYGVELTMLQVLTCDDDYFFLVENLAQVWPY
jgi:hypothetical protein